MSSNQSGPNAEKSVESGSEKTEIDEIKKLLPRFGVRHIQVLQIFLLFNVSFSHIVNMSVAIVAMVNNSENPKFEAFDWDISTQSLILSSLFWGYVCVQIPAGPLTQRFGAKNILLISTTLSSVFNLLIPLGASIGGWKAVVVFRILMGLGQGFLYPCSHSLLSNWVPPSERGSLSTFCYAGSQLGTVATLAFSGVIASLIGWPSIFYISGSLSLVWVVFWFFYGASKPSNSKRISGEERKYIESCNGVDERVGNTLKAPWKEILTSVPVWSLIFVYCCHNWGFWTLLTNMPTYMKNILNFDISSNGLLSSIPYFAKWVLSFVFGFMSDYIVNKQILKTSTSRKLFNTIGHWIPMIILIGLGFVSPDQEDIAVALIVVAVAFSGGTFVGLGVNHMDLSPNYAGTLMSLTNLGSNIVSIIVPLAVGAIITDKTDHLQWRIVFFISAGVYFIGNFVFIIFGQASLQPFNAID